MSTNYDLWKFRGDDDFDAEGEAREEWEADLDIISALDYSEASDLLLCALVGDDIRPRLTKLIDKAWEQEKQRRIERNYD